VGAALAAVLIAMLWISARVPVNGDISSLLKRTRKRFLSRIDGAHPGFDAASFRPFAIAFRAGRRCVSFWPRGSMVAEAARSR